MVAEMYSVNKHLYFIYTNRLITTTHRWTSQTSPSLIILIWDKIASYFFFTTVEKIIARKHFINEISSPTEWLQVTKEIISLRKGRMENRILCRTFVSTKLTVAIQFYTVM